MPKHTDEAKNDAIEGKEDMMYEPTQEDEENTKAKKSKKLKIRIQPPFPRRLSRNMEVKEMSELLKVLKEKNS